LEDILAKIEELGDELALVMIGGVNYYTGQLFDMKAITEAGHKVGAYVGFDLAHAAGNINLKLHDWGVDFACWCSYKYMNSSPGGISGVFIHEKHFNNPELNRFAGWWGYKQDTRFKMTKGFVPEKGAEGWQLSCSPVMLMAIHKSALLLMKEAGGMATLRAKSEKLTAYLAFWIAEINTKLGYEQFKIITPSNPLGNIVVTYSEEARKKLSDNTAFSDRDLKLQIQRTLSAAKLISDNTDPKKPTLYVEVTNIRVRSIANRMFLGWMSGADYVMGNVTVKDVSGKTLDAFQISTDHYESYTVGTNNVLSWIYETFADDILKELKNEAVVKK
jgi:hypothetical protein